MSDAPTPPSGPAARSGCGTMVVLLVGIVMLVPGFCVIAFLVQDGFAYLNEPFVMFLCLVGLLVSALGVCLITLVSPARPR